MTDEATTREGAGREGAGREGAGREIAGQVKWFDAGKGFGFVVAEGEPRDILLHANVLRNFGQGSVADGALMTMRVQDTARGAQVVEILEIHQPERGETGQPGVLSDLVNLDLSAVPVVPARVKWFDRGKGFGFANVWGKVNDVFIHAEVLRQAGMSELQPGEAIALQVVEGRRGLMAARVMGWDFAVEPGQGGGG